MDSMPDTEFVVKWHPFLLRPGMPENGVAKGGDPSSRVGARLKTAGQRSGVNFTGLTDRYPNSVKAHALLEYASSVAENGDNSTVQEILFRHYFTDGLYPDETNLAAAAVEAGLDAKAAMSFVNSQEARESVMKKAGDNSRNGIRGVPYFYINGNPAFSGAQPPSAFVEAFRSA